MLRKIKILITGAGGTLAGYAPKVFSPYELFLANRDILDITNVKQVRTVFRDMKPDGSPRRNSDNTKAKDKVGFTAKISLTEGLQKNLLWYKAHYL